MTNVSDPFWLSLGSGIPMASAYPPQATQIATTPIQDLLGLPRAFFCRPAEEVAPELVGCLLVKRQEGGEMLW
jgi:hypothetical protein